ncbi:MAG: hypothetical protein PHR56_01890 [Dehalococcoidales bacterium]|nr:hypothetical protein [Dehalococcoidales bacterium]
MEEGTLKKLISNIKCSSCRQRYESQNVEVLGCSDQMWFIQALCSSCHTQSLVVAMVQKTRHPEPVTDLTRTEQGKFVITGAVNSDDLLKMHNYLKTFDGDFMCLFESNKTQL